MWSLEECSLARAVKNSSTLPTEGSRGALKGDLNPGVIVRLRNISAPWHRSRSKREQRVVTRMGLGIAQSRWRGRRGAADSPLRTGHRAISAVLAEVLAVRGTDGRQPNRQPRLKKLSFPTPCSATATATALPCPCRCPCFYCCRLPLCSSSALLLSPVLLCCHAPSSA